MRFASPRSLRRLTFSALALLAGCGSPADVAGNYSVNLTSGPNGCGLDGWTEGATTTGVALEIVQDDEDVTLTVQGLTGTALELSVGSRVFVGTIHGDHIDARLTGRAGSMGSCAFTTIIELDANVDGDVMTGRLRWFAQTNGLESCGTLNSCENSQQLNGARPPTSDS